MRCFCSIYTVHDEVKDKAFVLDLSWVGECELISDIYCGVCQLQSHFLGRFYSYVVCKDVTTVSVSDWGTARSTVWIQRVSSCPTMMLRIRMTGDAE